MAVAAQWFGLLLLFAGFVQLAFDSTCDAQPQDAAKNDLPRWEPYVSGVR